MCYYQFGDRFGNRYPQKYMKNAENSYTSIYAFADDHGAESSIRNICKQIDSQSPDIIISAGDICNMWAGVATYKQIELELRSRNKRLYLAIGNHDIKRLSNISKSENIVLLSGIKISVSGIEIAGIGLDNAQENYERLLRSAERKSQLASGPLILVSHIPPIRYLNEFMRPDSLRRINKNQKLSGDDYLVAKWVDKLVQVLEPSIVICGHFHGCVGKIIFGRTQIINPGPKGVHLVL